MSSRPWHTHFLSILSVGGQVAGSQKTFTTFLLDEGEASNIKLGWEYAVWSSFRCQLVTLITPTAASAQNLIQTFCTSTATVCTMGQAHQASGIDRICFIRLQLKTGLWMTGDWHWTNGAKYGWHSATNWKFKLIFAPRASQAIEADSKSDNFRGTWSC